MMAIMFTAATSQAGAADSLARLLGAASRDGAYQAPAAREVVQAEALFQRCFERCDEASVLQGWQQLGFEVVHAEHGGQALIVVRENANARHGRGFFAFRPKSASTTVLQAPHSFKDEHTREILLHLLEGGGFRAAAWNTVPRHYNMRNGVTVDADLAHLPDSYFTAFSRAFARHAAAGKLVQLHGFAQEKRRSSAGASAEMVISSGSREPTTAVLAMGGCLKRANLGEVRIYPTEIRELGATTNTIASAFRAEGHAGFVHIEMSAPTRLALLNDTAARANLLRCLEK